jgi:hypothetical protein
LAPLSPAQQDGDGARSFGRGDEERGLGRTEVIVEKAHSAVAGDVGIPVCDGLEPF